MIKYNSNLKRKINKMTKYIKDALVKNDVLDEYKNRPPYQRNDYIGWIERAKRDETKQKRINQMLDELKKGNVYMKMEWNPKQ